MMELAIILIPFAGTAVGAAMVFFMREKMNSRLEKLLLGFASGVMIAASVWSLLDPAIEMAGQQGKAPWLPVSVGFLLGIGFLLALDCLVPHIHPDNSRREGVKSGFGKTTMLMLAVSIHNLPEGMAVGVALAGAMLENTGMSMAGALVLSMGIAIQNFPEGAIISMPLRNTGASRRRAFWYGVLSGIVEPLGAAATILLAEQAMRVLPYMLAFAAGAMIYVVADELIPEARDEGDTSLGTVGVAFGFVLMMALDVALG